MGPVEKGSVAKGQLQRDDILVSVDGITLEGRNAQENATAFSEAVGSHECPGTPRDGCRAETPALVTHQGDHAVACHLRDAGLALDGRRDLRQFKA